MGDVQKTRVGSALGAVALACAARPRRTLVLITIATLLVGGGWFQLEHEADLLKLMPEGDPHTVAAQNASETFRGFYDFVTVFYAIDEVKCREHSDRLLPARVTPQDCTQAMDEVYIRAMDELEDFFQQRMPELEYAIDLANIVKTVNWTNSGYFGDRPDQTIVAPAISGDLDGVGRPDDAAFSMPGTDPLGELRFEAAWRAANAVDESVDDVIGEGRDAARSLFFFNTSSGMSRVELGQRFYRTVDAYQEAVEACDDADAGTPCTLTWNVWHVVPGEPSFPVRGVSTLDAHASDVTKRDFNKLAPLIVWAIVVILYLAFRDPRVLLVAAANLFVSFLWTASLMGWLEIPFSALNLTVVPLILGVGIDYGIHLVSEFLEHRSDGMRDAQAFAQAGERAGIAMLIATVTTSAGLMVMAFSPSVLMGQLGIVSALALIVTFVFTLTFVPALLSLTSPGTRMRRHKGSPWVAALAGWNGRHRIAIGVVVVALTGAAWISMQELEPEPFGNPDLNYPRGDRVRDDAERINDVFFGGVASSQTNYLIVEGDFTDPEAHMFLDVLERRLQEDAVLEGFNTATMTRVVRAWVSIDEGTPDAAVSQVIAGIDTGIREGGGPETPLSDYQYPQTQAEMEATLEAIFASPFANFMTILLDPDFDIGVVAFDTRQSMTHADVEAVWAATQRVIAEAREETGYDGVAVHQFGNNAMSYLFVAKQQPWVAKVAYVAFGLVVTLIALLTRSVRATACTGSIMLVTSIWWLGLLPVLGIGLSVGLMLPLVFIMAIGTDDAVHLIWNIHTTHDKARVYRFVGQAVLLTSLTTVVAFGIFSLQTDLLVRRSILGTAAAVAVMWVATMCVVPLFYPAHIPPRPRRLAAKEARIPAHARVIDARAPVIASPREETTSVNRNRGA